MTENYQQMLQMGLNQFKLITNRCPFGCDDEDDDALLVVVIRAFVLLWQKMRFSWSASKVNTKELKGFGKKRRMQWL